MGAGVVPAACGVGVRAHTFQVGGVVAHCQLPNMCVHRDGLILVQGKQAYAGSHLFTHPHPDCKLVCLLKNV